MQDLKTDHDGRLYAENRGQHTASSCAVNAVTKLLSYVVNNRVMEDHLFVTYANRNQNKGLFVDELIKCLRGFGFSSTLILDENIWTTLKEDPTALYSGPDEAWAALMQQGQSKSISSSIPDSVQTLYNLLLAPALKTLEPHEVSLENHQTLQGSHQFYFLLFGHLLRSLERKGPLKPHWLLYNPGYGFQNPYECFEVSSEKKLWLYHPQYGCYGSAPTHNLFDFDLDEVMFETPNSTLQPDPRRYMGIALRVDNAPPSLRSLTFNE